MSKIGELISRNIPDGIPFQKLGDVAVFQRGTTITKASTSEGEIPVLAGGQSPAYFHSSSNRSGENVVVAGSGAYAGFVSFWQGPIWVSDAFTINPKSTNLLPKYLFYFLKSKQGLIHALKQGGGVPHVYGKDVAKIGIQIPPIEIQLEIVSVLENFVQLEIEIEKELKARKQQYQYFRNKLLSFPQEGVDHFELHEIFDLRNGYTPSKSNSEFWQGGEIPWFRLEDIRENGRVLMQSLQNVPDAAIKGGRKKLFPANSILISTSATIGENALITVPHLANQRFTSMTIKREFEGVLDAKFAFYFSFLLADWCRKNTTVSSFASVDMAGFRKFKFPIPPLVSQREIVQALDSFVELVLSIENELSLRRKQSEYFRNRLVSFKELAA
jgi:type I restriction enzyme S subunit